MRADPSSVAESAPLVGGRYAVARCLGSGTHSRVYLAWDVHRREWVALRVPICSTAASVARRARFREEMEAASSAVHPYLARAASDDHAGLPFAVLELAECGTVQGWLERHGAMPPRRAVAVARRCADAVGHLHANGRAHGDVRPDRLLIRVGGVLLAWPGLAREASPFRAPEQDDAPADARADAYGIGATLYTLLTGAPPRTLAGVEADDERLAAIPSTLRPLVVMCCRRDPHERYASGTELVVELDRLASPLPIDPDTPPLDGARLALPADPRVLEDLADLADLPATLALFPSLAPSASKATTPPAAQRRSVPPAPPRALTLPPEPRAPTPPPAPRRTADPAPRRSTPPAKPRTHTPPSEPRTGEPPVPGRAFPWRVMLVVGVLVSMVVAGAVVCSTAVSGWSTMQASQEAALRRAAAAEAELVAGVERQTISSALGNPASLSGAWDVFRAAGPQDRGAAAGAFVEAVAAYVAERDLPPALRAEVLHLQRLRKNWDATQGR